MNASGKREKMAMHKSMSRHFLGIFNPVLYQDLSPSSNPRKLTSQLQEKDKGETSPLV